MRRRAAGALTETALLRPIPRLTGAVTIPGSSSSASRHVYMSGNAVMRACQEAKRRWDEVLRAETGETEVAAEVVYHGRSARPTTDYTPGTGMCDPHISYSPAAQIALVEVDTETGEVEVLKMWAATDAGKVINPAMVFGQVAGGVHMGVGYGLSEEFIQREGKAVSRLFSHYHVPTVLDMPHEFESVAVEVPDPTGPFGASGIGEATTLPTAPAILNAIHDATGVWLDTIPATPERVFFALSQR